VASIAEQFDKDYELFKVTAQEHVRKVSQPIHLLPYCFCFQSLLLTNQDSLFFCVNGSMRLDVTEPNDELIESYT
jgi:hypothetical protein